MTRRRSSASRRDAWGVLLPLYRMLDAGAVTANEQAFVATYDAELQAALAHCREFSRTGQEAMLQLSWERFYAVLKQLARELQDSKTLQLSSVSPQLLQALMEKHQPFRWCWIQLVFEWLDDRNLPAKPA